MIVDQHLAKGRAGRSDVPVSAHPEALDELERARSAWMEAGKAAGKPIPQPKYRPAIYQTPS